MTSRAPEREEAHVALAAGDTLTSALKKLTRAFHHAGIETPEVDARFLMQGVLGIDATAFFLNGAQTLDDGVHPLAAAAARRLKFEPVSRILGKREFYGRAFEVTPDVLDPRPDTETLIDAALEVADVQGWRDRPIRIADIGTGSGAILVTLLAELPLATGVATDISPAALQVAERNAHRHGVAERFLAIETRGIENVAGPLDLIISNPPYIPSGDLAGLATDVRLYDPAQALDGGADGLTIYREIAINISMMDNSIWVIVEVGARQARDVGEIFQQACGPESLSITELRRDLGGHVRSVTMQHHVAESARK